MSMSISRRDTHQYMGQQLYSNIKNGLYLKIHHFPNQYRLYYPLQVLKSKLRGIKKSKN